MLGARYARLVFAVAAAVLAMTVVLAPAALLLIREARAVEGCRHARS